jgi:4-diphosphocytidyl-2-C-methyl-D-erythritol kinase
VPRRAPRDGRGEDEPAGAGLARAHAKLNLGLRVLSRRPDGFHEVDTIMVALDLHDDVAVRVARGRDTLERLPSGDARLDRTALPLDRGNLVLQALDAYRAAAVVAGAPPPPPLSIGLRKRVPLAGGLGGGSSDAAAALRLFAALWPAPVDLPRVAASLGSDVPFFLAGEPWMRARGRGERLEPLASTALASAAPPSASLASTALGSAPPPSASLASAAPALASLTAVLVNPGVPVSAADAYRWWTAAEGAVSGAGMRWSGLDLTNDLQAGVAARVPAVAEVLDWLRARGPGPVQMSGSGSTCFAIVDDARLAADLARRARAERGWWALVARAADRSSLRRPWWPAPRRP